MRENMGLYRGKWNGVWVEGAFCPKNCDDPFGPMVDKPSIIKLDEPNDGFWFDVDPSTVGQYAGMPDKNGKQIFEGDIVRDMDGTTYPVVWGGTGFYLRYDPPHAHGMEYELLPLCNYWHAHGPIIEIIGNIHDNPELMGGGAGND